MSPEAEQAPSSDTALLNGNATCVPLGPSLFSRVQEPDSDGQVYDIEILTQSTGTSDDDDSLRLAACTLRIGAPVDKNRQRMVDGKIENLWLKDEGSGIRLDNVRMLATLLSYVREFCADIEVPHISSIQRFDHPAWLRDFFTIAGFDRCQCLKPEAGTQRYRACLKLDSPDTVAAQTSVTDKPKGEIDQPSNSTKVNGKENETILPRVIPSPHASAGLTVAETSPAKRKPSLNLPRVTEAIIAKQRPVSELPKVPATVSVANLQNGTKSPVVEPSAVKMFSTDQASAWLSQNKEMLGTVSSSPAANSSQPRALSPKQNEWHEDELIKKDEALAGEKRKRGDAPDRSTRQRRDTVGSGNDSHVQEALLDEELPLKSRTNSDQPLPATKYAFSMVDKAAKPKRSIRGRSDDLDMTDALLAEVDKANPDQPPKKIKKEPKSSRPASLPSAPPPPESRHLRSPDLPSKILTCYYWKRGGCNKRDDVCSYAHYETGHNASAPGSWKYKYSSYAGQFDGAADPYSNPNGISIKGSYDGGNESISAPTGPRADAERLPYIGSQWKSIDRYRPQ